ncbi:MAG: CAP domain-containing protein [Lachnospiraceae bacterium]|nr:CAP domain-containing protein [Lachnospiraceae bacterium]
MKKLALFTVGILSILCLGGQSLTANAASQKNFQVYKNGNFVIISGNFCPTVPDNNKPDSNLPDAEIPENDNNNTEDSTNISYVEQVVKLVNEERAKEGLSPLTINTKVQAAAQVRAKECEQSFSHTRPDGRGFATALKEQNVSYHRAGENIAWGQKSPEEVVKAWMNSAGHRANIMNKNYTSIGVGYYQNAKGINYWSQLFIG